MPRAKILAKELKEVRSFEDLLTFLNRLIQDIMTGRVTSKQGQAITGALAGVRATIQDLMDHGGGEIARPKMYDFNPSGYPKPGDEPIAALPDKTPSPCPTDKLGAGDEAEQVVAVELVKEVIINAEMVQEEVTEPTEAEKAEKQEEMQDRREGLEGERSSILFTDKEEYWDRLERMQHPGLDLD